MIYLHLYFLITSLYLKILNINFIYQHTNINSIYITNIFSFSVGNKILSVGRRGFRGGKSHTSPRKDKLPLQQFGTITSTNKAISTFNYRSCSRDLFFASFPASGSSNPSSCRVCTPWENIYQFPSFEKIASLFGLVFPQKEYLQ